METQKAKRKKLSELTGEDYIGSPEYDNCPITQDIEEIKEWLELYNEENELDGSELLVLEMLQIKVAVPIYLKPIDPTDISFGDRDLVDPEYFSNLEDSYEDYELSKESPIYKAIEKYNEAIIKDVELGLIAFNELNQAIRHVKEILGFRWSNIRIDLSEEK